MFEPLTWFPKRMRQGDLDSPGAQRLLGTTSLSPLEVLVRETAQNSWDARLDARRPEYGILLRTPDFRQRTGMSRLLQNFRNDSITKELSAQPFHNIEIYDRNTHGLSGRVDMRSSGRGTIDRFKELIYTIGSTEQRGDTGGTFGFGKTAAYAASRMGTVVYWSRVRKLDGEGLEDRFIVSAFRDGYYSHGQQFTGRHWWGEVTDDEVRPIVGDRAERLGNEFFHRAFEPGETGTSLLILDARFGPGEDALADSSSQFFDKASTAVRRHLWPKLTPPPGASESPMLIKVADDQRHTDFDGEHGRGAFSSWSAGLNAIRATRMPASESKATSRFVKVFPIGRRRELLGHLAIVERIGADTYANDDLEPTPDADEPPFRIALMRGKTELIVNTVDWVNEIPEVGVEWVAIFKSSDDLEMVYAAAEPPAHDRWDDNQSVSTRPDASLIIKHTKKRIKQIIREHLFSESDTPKRATGDGNASYLASRLGALLPPSGMGAELDGNEPHRDRGAAGRRSSKWKVVAQRPRIVGGSGYGQRQRIDFQIVGPGRSASLQLHATLAGEDGTRTDQPQELLDLTWSGAHDVTDDSATYTEGAYGHVVFTSPWRRALSVRLTARNADGDI